MEARLSDHENLQEEHSETIEEYKNFKAKFVETEKSLRGAKVELADAGSKLIALRQAKHDNEAATPELKRQIAADEKELR